MFSPFLLELQIFLVEIELIEVELRGEGATRGMWIVGMDTFTATCQ